MRHGMYLQRTVILGFTDTAVHVADHLQRNGDIRSGLIGFIDDRTERIPKSLSNLPLLGNTRELEKLIRAEQVNQVMICLPWAAEQRIHGLVNRLRQMSVNVMLVPDMAALRYGHSRISEVGGILMFNTSQLPLRGWSPVIKRLEDCLLASLALVVLSPLMLVTAIAIKLDSKARCCFARTATATTTTKSAYSSSARCTPTRATSPLNARPPATRASPGRAHLQDQHRRAAAVVQRAEGNMSMVGPPPCHGDQGRRHSLRGGGERIQLAAPGQAGITGWAQINGYRGKPTRCSRSRNVSSTTWSTSPSGRSGLTCTSSS
jgi:hypothetical protein